MGNIELAMQQRRYINGYPSLASFIASDEDRTTAIFKRFDRLAARNLLYLQSELAELQKEQDDLDEKDRRAGKTSPVKQAARNLEALKNLKGENGNGNRRVELILEIREKMKEYRKAVLVESTLASLPSPHSRTLKAFRTKFFNAKVGSDEAFPTLGGASQTLYDDEHDLVALKSPQDQDRLFLLVQDYLGFLFSEDKEKHVSGRVGYISGRRLTTFIAWLSTVLSAILLIGAVVVLYEVQNKGWRLGLIALFTTLFAGSVGLLTNARRAELFAATAAYMAVLVVFVSGDLGASTSKT